MKTVDNKPVFFLFTCIKDGNDYVDKLFDSLLNQTKINFIHFIYEDGSSVPLGDKIAEYKNKVSQLDNPYKVIYEYNPINIGLNKSTQYCISKCSCPYFIWIDCDNYVDSHFFEELEKAYYKNKKATIIRSVLLDSDSHSPKRSNCGTLEEVCRTNQLGLLIRRRYYYSFFAVKYEDYKRVNPRNIFDEDRRFYNDEQVLLLCLLTFDKSQLTKKALGYFKTHEGQESSMDQLSLEELKALQIRLCEKVNKQLKTKIEACYGIKELYECFFSSYKTDYKKAVHALKDIKLLSKNNHISLKNYYDYSIFKNLLRTYYWKIRKKWRN